MPKDCFIDSAPNLSLGSAALVSALTVVNQNIGVCCVLNTIYIIGFDNGNNFNGGWRRMSSDASATQYNLYKPGDSTVWITSNTQTGTGSGATQNAPYRAIVNLAQGNVPAGTYNGTM